jgi:hypothetical protein
MGLDLIPKRIHKRFQIEERRHACAILSNDFPNEFADVIGCLGQFKLVRSEIVVGGGGKSRIAQRFDDYLKNRGWQEKSTGIEMIVDGIKQPMELIRLIFSKTALRSKSSGIIKTHSILAISTCSDCYTI